MLRELENILNKRLPTFKQENLALSDAIDLIQNITCPKDHKIKVSIAPTPVPFIIAVTYDLAPKIIPDYLSRFFNQETCIVHHEVYEEITNNSNIRNYIDLQSPEYLAIIEYPIPPEEIINLIQ